MESLPTWLSDAIVAAGMTAYADELYPKAIKEIVSPQDVPAQNEPAPPLY